MATPLIEWINTLSVHDRVRETEWVIPAVQSVHILAVSVAFASSLVLALRAWALAGLDWAPALWVGRLRGWIWGALVVLLLSGATMILGEPERTLNNSTFQLKVVLILIAIACAALLMRRLESSRDSSAGTRALAVALVLLWAATIAAGRWIAYT